MFIIAGLGIYQIFHNRHPCFTPNAHILYFSFALLIIVAFCGALYPSTGFWIVEIMVYLAWTVFVSFQFYYNGIIKLGNFSVVMKLLRTNYKEFPAKPSNIPKFIYVICLYILNLALWVCVYLCLTNHMGSISSHITPLVINSLKGGHACMYVCTCTHTYAHVYWLCRQKKL